MKGYDSKSDNDLIRAFQSGDNQALEALIKRHKDKLFTAIFMFVKDQHLAEDLFQEVFIKIIHAFRSNRYNEKDNFIAWAVRVARNYCIDHFRKVKRQPVEYYDEFSMSELIIDPDGPNRIEKHEISNDLQEWIDQLPTAQREVVVLRHFGEMTFREIADLTNCGVNTALGRMRYALENLKKIAKREESVEFFA
jgi:RNA polymerase sigma-70 factor (ECF subfamily)